MQFALISLIGLSLAVGTLSVDYDYEEALSLTLYFYEANRSGYLPSDNRISWRDDSATDDGDENNVDLEGGYYDAGDHVKFNFPMAFSTTVLAWGGIDFKDGYKAAGELSNLRDAVQWATDYFLKCSDDFDDGTSKYWIQVGNGYLDHSIWGRPEDMTMSRPAYYIDSSKPGSDVAAETAAAMAAASILFEGHDDDYSSELLTRAVLLFDFAKTYVGKYSDSVSEAASFYYSSHYKDELAWAAAWLHLATDDDDYITIAESYYDDASFTTDVFSWDWKIAGAAVLLYDITGDSEYKSDLNDYCDEFRDSDNYSPLGEYFYSQWGSLRYSSNSALICLQAYNLGIDKTKNLAAVKAQAAYILGDSDDDDSFSYLIGYGSNYPMRPHHRSSSCSDSSCDWNDYNLDSDNPHTLNGALVGGPQDAYDNYYDERSNYICNEVTTDYNAGFGSMIAGLAALD